MAHDLAGLVSVREDVQQIRLTRKVESGEEPLLPAASDGSETYLSTAKLLSPVNGLFYIFARVVCLDTTRQQPSMHERSESIIKWSDVALFPLRTTLLGVGGLKHIVSNKCASLTADVIPPEVLAEGLFAFLKLHSYQLELGEQPRLVACRLHL